ncbi:DNA-binding transcriptional regulator, XRE-family HTH domain [Pedobacter westerhofensis]|uniref:DNA-binding transcriptional regulator, XRE-family HTH domain n=1 Tax=Pedobacter westerhofensis TaxID=425512 RepID=A0A521FRP6_9SPHI|nr:helix-turn-helix transcriptional regulator [Pedobacter westerhofensis]SMO98905.1 DNA-binding transcriptional regulator, XRE-family HTH domain [Pedobacter westerhofensis]
MRKLIYNIKVLRETAGLSIEELARELGTTPRSYLNVETEQTEITLMLFRKLLRFYKISASELVEFGLTREQIDLKYMTPVDLITHPLGREAVLVQLEIADILRHIIELKISAHSKFIPFNPN